MDIEQLAGTKLGNYEVESLLGRGGMGVVYKARQVNLDRSVALKILFPHLSSDISFVKRFKREARAVAKLSHSNIIQIIDISEDKDLHFFSMEYVEGKTLDKVLEEKGKLEPSEAVKIVSQAAGALEHAHKNNIIHRDVKPSNIILDNHGNVKVMDFGLARAADDRSKVTQTGTLIGTLRYMSPEQCRGEEIDFQTDIYSLGVVLYEMLTGKAPFDAPNEAAMIHKIISKNPTEARRLNPAISNDLDAIVSRSISKDRDERYVDIPEFLKEIREVTGQTSSLSIEQRKSPASIAVLPFVNMSADPEQEYFCDGISEELINALTQLKDLKVIARTSAFSFRGKEVDVRHIGRKLGVGNILEGSVRKAGNRLRITAQLVDTADGRHIWSERYDRELDDVFAIQDEITLAIMDKLKVKLLGGEKATLAKHEIVDLEAYDLYLKGRYFWNKMTEEDLKRAIEYFQQAIEKTPNYAPAYAGLADSYCYLPIYGVVPTMQAYPRARAAALKALEIDDTLVEAYVSLGSIKTYYDWNWEGAEKEFQRAIELSPDYALAHHWYAMYLLCQARFDDAVSEMRHALELDPLSLVINRDLGFILSYAGRADQAMEALHRTIEIDPNFPTTHEMLAWLYFNGSRYEEAKAAFEREMAISGGRDPRTESSLASFYALTGDKHKTQTILADLLTRSKRAYVPAYSIAGVYIHMGEIEQGFQWLDKAYEERDIMLSHLKVGPEFTQLRSDPRYMALLKKMGLEQ